MFKPAELAPGGVKLAGHAQEFKGQSARIGRGHGEMVIAPAAGGQALQLQMGIKVYDIPPSVGNMPGVVEDGRVLGIFAHAGLYAAAIFGVHHIAMAGNVLIPGGIHALIQHGTYAAGAHTPARRGNVQKQPRGMIAVHDLLHLGA